jgi:hypothetical protein
VPLASQVLASLVPLSAKGELQCPRAIIQSRAFVARLKPVRDLRPQALPVKLLAIGAASAAANVPMGMWREHTKKFSAQWFLAVHATIPFIAMLRKGVVMPKWAIAMTIATAIVGQAAGARLERQRLAAGTASTKCPQQHGSMHHEEQMQLAAAPMASVAAANPAQHLRGGYQSEAWALDTSALDDEPQYGQQCSASAHRCSRVTAAPQTLAPLVCV